MSTLSVAGTLQALMLLKLELEHPQRQKFNRGGESWVLLLTLATHSNSSNDHYHIFFFHYNNTWFKR
jgi:hypothetical protein